MSEQVSFVQEGVDRVGDAFRSFDAGFQRLQKDLRGRRKTFEKQINTSRKTVERQINAGRRDFEKATRKRVNELRKNPAVKRAIGVRNDATKQFESRVSTVLGFFNVATRSDLDRIERKLGQIAKKLKGIERAKRANGSAAVKAS